MVLKEETADVVSFRESAHGEQMPRVQARERAEAKGEDCARRVGERAVRALEVQVAEASQAWRGECDESI